MHGIGEQQAKAAMYETSSDGDWILKLRQSQRKAARIRGIVHSLPKGVTACSASGYNQLVMSTVCDAAEKLQFASSLWTPARVLAALLSVSEALSGESAFPIAS